MHVKYWLHKNYYYGFMVPCPSIAIWIWLLQLCDLIVVITHFALLSSPGNSVCFERSPSSLLSKARLCFGSFHNTAVCSWRQPLTAR